MVYQALEYEVGAILVSKATNNYNKTRIGSASQRREKYRRWVSGLCKELKEMDVAEKKTVD